MRLGPVAAAASLLVVGAAAAAPPERNGFALDPVSIPVDEILPGGPPRDGIPALDAPRHAPADAAPWSEDEHVVGVALGAAARAYPLAILVWHELVNDSLGGRPILVSYCPLCGTAMVFDRRVEGRARSFGVSGLLWRSDLLLYDRETESLWSQIASRSVAGPSLDQRLELVRSRVTSWGAWKAEHPGTTVLTPETGHRRPYGRDPYAGYAASEQLRFPAPRDPRYHPKTPTLGLRTRSGEARAYPADELLRAGGNVRDQFAGAEVAVSYDGEQGTFAVRAPPEIEVVEGYWFAWAAFHPETEVFSASEPDGGRSPSSPATR